jgi:two-component system, sensor histidine kinase PdtaS
MVRSGAVDKYLRTTIILLFIAANSTLAQQHKIDSLQALIKKGKEDTNKVRHLLKLHLAYKGNNNYPGALNSLNEALQLSQNLDFEDGAAQSYRYMGIVYENQGNFYKAKDLDLAALKIEKRRGNKQGMAAVYNNLANAINKIGEKGKALEYYAEAVKLNKETGNKNWLSVNYVNIGRIYYMQGKPDKALEVYLEAKKIKEEGGAKKDADYANVLANIAGIYVLNKEYDKAFSMCNDAISISEAINDLRGMAAFYHARGDIFFQKAKIEKDEMKRAQLYSNALQDLRSASKLSEQMGDAEGVARQHLYIGIVYMQQGKEEDAKKELLAGLELAKESGSFGLLTGLYETLASCDSTSGNWKGAYEYHKLLKQYHDSLYNEADAQKVAEMNARFESEKKETQITQLEKEKKQIRTFVLIFAGLVLITLFFVQRAYNNKKKLAELMAAENKRKEILLQEVNHRINNNLMIISSLLSLQANSAEDERISEYLKQSQNRIQSLASLHELLFMNNSSIQINMKEYLDKVMDFHRDILKTLEGNINVDMNIPNKGFPTQVAVPIALIVNELVTNSMKYAFKGAHEGKIDISLVQFKTGEGKWVLRVSDTGKGLPADNNYRKDSLGLRLVNLMTKQMKGVLTQSNSPGATFEISFNLPS